MYISSISIVNFRKFGQTPFEMKFKAGLNILLGENNVGKTTILEAIALCLSIGDIDKPVSLSASDFNNPLAPIEIKLTFSGLSPEQEAACIVALSKIETGEPSASMTFIFELKGSRVLTTITCGENDSSKPSNEMMTYIHCNYLKAVRDVTLEFTPGFRNRIARILERRFNDLTETQVAEFVAIFNKANQEAKSFSIPIEKTGEANEEVKETEMYCPIDNLEKQANGIIQKLQFAGDDNAISLCFIEHELRRILRNVIAKLQTLNLELSLNGMGYNNLIYLAMLLTELDKGYDKHEYVCLIVEEPEAHLHPQLQKLLLEFFIQDFKHIQVILSSHSPIFVSDSVIDDLIVLTANKATDMCPTPLKDTGLSSEAKTFLRRFLDVSRAQLLFARNVVLVEGYSEAMLFKSFWNINHALPENKFHNQSIEVVNIEGVAFEYYVELVEKVFSRTGTKCVVMTDDDRGTGIDVPTNQKIIQETSLADAVDRFDITPLSSRYNKVKALIDGLKAKNMAIELCTSRKTLEVEIGLANSKQFAFLFKVAGESEEYWRAKDGKDVEIALDLWQRVRADKLAFAAKVMDEIDASGAPQMPEHFKKAFDFIGGTSVANGADAGTTENC